MIYRITVDGVRKYAEASIVEYSQEADNRARESIIRYYLDERGAGDVQFDTTHKEAMEVHKAAKDFYTLICDFDKAWSELPYEKKWGAAEIKVIIPFLTDIYTKAMSLPDTEFTEDSKYEGDTELFKRACNFDKSYEYYQMVFDPYKWRDRPERDQPGKDNNICLGWLNDDIGSVMTELALGAEAYLEGHVYDALFQWKEGLAIHYGRHLTNALNTMCRVWEDEYLHRGNDPHKAWTDDFRSDHISYEKVQAACGAEASIR